METLKWQYDTLNSRLVSKTDIGIYEITQDFEGKFTVCFRKNGDKHYITKDDENYTDMFKCLELTQKHYNDYITFS